MPTRTSSCPGVLRDRRITGRDAAFATELAYGATRLRGRYDPIVAAAADRPVSAVDPAVLDTLRLGLHQLLGMRVPPHAATAETVALARQVNGAGAAGFVNAVLRRVAERDLAEWLDVLAPPEPAARRAAGDPLLAPAVDHRGAARRPARTRPGRRGRPSSPSWKPSWKPTTSPPRSRWPPGPASATSPS